MQTSIWRYNNYKKINCLQRSEPEKSALSVVLLRSPEKFRQNMLRCLLLETGHILLPYIITQFPMT